MADEKADLMLSDGFWPDYVTCTTWKPRKQSHGQRSTRSLRQHERQQERNNEIYMYDQGCYYRNRFSSPSEDID